MPVPDYARFAVLVLRASRMDMGDVDGGDIQDWATECGLLEKVTVTEPCAGECRCAEYGDFPTTCYRETAATREVKT